MSRFHKSTPLKASRATSTRSPAPSLVTSLPEKSNATPCWLFPSVVIVSWNTRELVLRCLERLTAALAEVSQAELRSTVEALVAYPRFDSLVAAVLDEGLGGAVTDVTVFAPTNDAFAKLPEGTVENLVKPENVATLRKILQYHVTTSALNKEWLKDGQTLGMANGKKTTIHVEGDTVKINDATIIASIPASNGIVHVVDTVLLPPE